MKPKTLDALLLVVGLAGLGGGAYELARPRPPHDLSIIEWAGAETRLGTPESVPYARKAIPGMAAFYAGGNCALAYFLRQERRKKG